MPGAVHTSCLFRRVDEFLKAQLEEWNPSRGFGFLRRGRRRIFMHITDFRAPLGELRVGGTYRFKIGADVQGRQCAVGVVPNITKPVRERGARNRASNPERINPGNDFAGLRASDLAIIAGLLILPAVSFIGRDLDLFIPSIWVGIASLLTFFIYRDDKRRAENGEWRISEFRLHFLEAIGGWPGALLAQRVIRHKCSKVSYNLSLWMIIISHQLIAFDALNGWSFLGQFVPALRS
jgi:uncharacterized membrane protein YsdA (DUF1294 family)/cold shock CspA family protein